MWTAGYSRGAGIANELGGFTDDGGAEAYFGTGVSIMIL